MGDIATTNLLVYQIRCCRGYRQWLPFTRCWVNPCLPSPILSPPRPCRPVTSAPSYKRCTKFSTLGKYCNSFPNGNTNVVWNLSMWLYLGHCTQSCFRLTLRASSYISFFQYPHLASSLIFTKCGFRVGVLTPSGCTHCALQRKPSQAISIHLIASRRHSTPWIEWFFHPFILHLLFAERVKRLPSWTHYVTRTCTTRGSGSKWRQMCATSPLSSKEHPSREKSLAQILRFLEFLYMTEKET